MHKASTKTEIPVAARLVSKLLLVGSALLGFLSAVGGHAANGGNVPVRIFGTYSSLTHNHESGDLLGYEVMIIPTDLGFKAVVQVAEGAAGHIYIVNVATKGSILSFDIPLISGIRGRFEGEITSKGLNGKIIFPSGTEQVFLKRTISYWDRA